MMMADDFDMVLIELMIDAILLHNHRCTIAPSFPSIDFPAIIVVALTSFWLLLQCGIEFVCRHEI